MDCGSPPGDPTVNGGPTSGTQASTVAPGNCAQGLPQPLGSDCAKHAASPIGKQQDTVAPLAVAAHDATTAPTKAAHFPGYDGSHVAPGSLTVTHAPPEGMTTAYGAEVSLSVVDSIVPANGSKLALASGAHAPEE